MLIEPLRVPGAFAVTPTQHGDHRGLFLESFRSDLLGQHLGHRFDVVQTNVSISARGTLRGVHFADVPPSQGKYVTCLTGGLIDYVVDIRVGSPTFGQWDSVLLDTVDRKAVLVPEGMGHAFFALEDHTTAMYLVTSTYNPSGEHGIHPLDPDLGIAFPEGITPVLSEKDRCAPTLAAALAQGLLPTWEQCQAYAAELAVARPL